MMAGQNTSSAVMAQRREPHDSVDDFPTPPWATRALFRHVLYPIAGVYAPDEYFRTLTAWEPACNRGYMARPMAEHFAQVRASDIFDYRWAGQARVGDFLLSDVEVAYCHWIITNPPFRLAEQFIARACRLAHEGVAMFVRASFLEGIERYTNLWSVNPPSVVAWFAERVVIHKGVLRDPQRPYWDPVRGEWKRATSATAYVWLVWQAGLKPQPPMWIPPCRKALERPGDYPEPEAGPEPEAMTLLGEG